MSIARSSLSASVVAVSLAVAAGTSAQTRVVTHSTTVTTPVEVVHVETHRHVYDGIDGWDGPRLTWGGELGMGAWVEDGPFGFGNGTGAATSAGPAWGVRVGVDVLPFLGFEARYQGMYNEGNASVRSGGYVSLLTNSGSVVMRLIAPIPFVRPYLFGGVGLYDTRVLGSASARQASSLTDSFEWGIPMGVGVDVPLGRRVSIGVEGAFHLLMGESLSTREEFEGGDPVTLSAIVRGHL